jgi:uncharacterized protein YprB with RNaseH-like and TPR domain
MQTVFFDIETEGLPKAELLKNAPEFKAASNLKDPIKVRESIAQKQQDYLDEAALSAITGRVLCVGIIHKGNFSVIHNDDEARLLADFWDFATDEKQLARRMVGFNTHAFDLPFLIRRSWKLDVQVPEGIRRGRYFNDNQVDLRVEWQCGDRQAHGSLDAVSRHLGIGQKNGDGAEFAALWHTNRAQALAYLENDVRLVEKAARKMGIV